MNLLTAFKIVLELAEHNVIDKDELPKEHKKQVTAIEKVRDYFENERRTDRFD